MFSVIVFYLFFFFFFQAEDGIRDAQESRGLGDVYKRQAQEGAACAERISIDQDDAVAPVIRLVGHLSRWKRIAALHANQRHPYVRKETPQFENSKSIKYLLGR
eukprot:TRINITY_DN8608_c0_g1_i2.p1 TRINITY_DN8608_c0_g1~~TRINITY_DN8608_c0_g1_i2.p1  ORF type:complete len:104 (+),score=44.79 TRINITY_DN8608_c0_g1_i2:81-392(+)